MSDIRPYKSQLYAKNRSESQTPPTSVGQTNVNLNSVAPYDEGAVFFANAKSTEG